MITKTIEEKITEAEEFLLGVEEMLKSISERRGSTNYREHSTDVKCLETEKYKVVAAKSEARYWKDVRGGVGTTGWITICYFTEGEETKKLTTSKITTRDQYNSCFDKRDLLFHNDVGLESLTDSKIEVAWLDKDGEKGPTYVVDLDLCTGEKNV